MIYFFIGIAILTNIVLFKRRKIPLYHVIWALLPVDYYGFHVAGVTIKLYMLYFVFIFAYLLSSQKVKITIKELAILLLVVISLFVSDLVNGLIFESIMQHLYFYMIVINAWLYCKCFKAGNDYNKMIEGMLLSTAVFGSMFIVIDASSKLGLNIPGMVANLPNEPGIIADYRNMDNDALINTFRLRGFESDPNAVNIMFIISATIALYQEIIENKKKWINKIAIIVSVVCIVLSDSRSGLVALAITMLLIANEYYKYRKYGHLRVLLLIFGFMLVMYSLISSGIINLGYVLARYFMRSSLLDQYGRVSIWKENFSKFISIDPLFGVGANQIKNYSSLSRACHNTWLEWICSTGLIIGLMMDIIFISPIFSRNGNIKERYDWASNLKKKLTYAYIGVVTVLFTFDYIANTYLLFLFIILVSLKRNTMTIESNEHGTRGQPAGMRIVQDPQLTVQ